MRISDWSSDVCSSDLERAEQRPRRTRPKLLRTGRANAMSSVRERARQLESDMKKMVLLAISAAGFLAGCERAPTFPEILMTYHDVDWLKTHEDQIPVIVAECEDRKSTRLNSSH